MKMPKPANTVKLYLDDWRHTNVVLAAAILPMLKEYKKNRTHIPFGMDGAKWELILTKMISGFESILNTSDSVEDMERIYTGLSLFSKYFLELWSE
jgi:hypothetical protein